MDYDPVAAILDAAIGAVLCAVAAIIFGVFKNYAGKLEHKKDIHFSRILVGQLLAFAAFITGMIGICFIVKGFLELLLN